MKKIITIAEVRKALKSESVVAGGLDEVCRMAICKTMESTEWLNREFTDEEIKNAMRACWKERGAGDYEFV
jgi:hypothetical protein